jgi:hypothetical protein
MCIYSHCDPRHHQVFFSAHSQRQSSTHLQIPPVLHSPRSETHPSPFLMMANTSAAASSVALVSPAPLGRERRAVNELRPPLRCSFRGCHRPPEPAVVVSDIFTGTPLAFTFDTHLPPFPFFFTLPSSSSFSSNAYSHPVFPAFTPHRSHSPCTHRSTALAHHRLLLAPTKTSPRRRRLSRSHGILHRVQAVVEVPVKEEEEEREAYLEPGILQLETDPDADADTTAAVFSNHRPTTTPMWHSPPPYLSPHSWMRISSTTIGAWISTHHAKLLLMKCMSLSLLCARHFLIVSGPVRFL